MCRHKSQWWMTKDIKQMVSFLTRWTLQRATSSERARERERSTFTHPENLFTADCWTEITTDMGLLSWFSDRHPEVSGSIHLGPPGSTQRWGMTALSPWFALCDICSVRRCWLNKAIKSKFLHSRQKNQVSSPPCWKKANWAALFYQVYTVQHFQRAVNDTQHSFEWIQIISLFTRSWRWESEQCGWMMDQLLPQSPTFYWIVPSGHGFAAESVFKVNHLISHWIADGW